MKYKLKLKYPSLPKDWEEGMEIGQGDRRSLELYSPCNGKYTDYYIPVYDVKNFPEFWEEVKEPLFVTEDGKDIYRGDDFWFVDNLWYVGKGRVTHPVFKPLYGYKQFSSKEAAEKYIEENKPLYSKKQVINVLKGFDRDINCFDERFDYNLYIERYKDEK